MIQPQISPAIYRLRPDFTALSITVVGALNAPSDAASAALLTAACKAANDEPWAQAHLEAWREAYRSFGAKPQRTPCSAEALRKRADRDGELPLVNAVVDLYNAVSLRYAVPVGGEDAARFEGDPALVVASGGEPFDTVQSGTPAVEHVDAGEVVWRDGRGVTCRRWNWRQGVRTRIAEDTQQMWFVLERLGPMPIDALHEAGEALIDGLRRLSPNLTASAMLLHREASASA